MALARTERGNHVYLPDGEVLNEFLWDRSRFVCIQGPIGCLSADTEFLTRDGWRRMDSWSGEDILAWGDGEAWFEQPRAYVNLPCDEMWRFRNEHALSMVLSDEHRVPLIGRTGHLKVRLASDVAASPGRWTVPTTFTTSGAFPLSDAQVRLVVAISADGCFPKRGSQIVICVRKERKKGRLRELLTAAGVMWSEHQHGSRETEVTFSIPRLPWMTKAMNWWDAPSSVLEVIMDEVDHWDGLYEGDDKRFHSTDRGNAEFIQFAAHATGRRATISVLHDQRGKDWKPLFIVHIAHRDSRKAKVMLRGDSVSIDRVKTEDGRKYCFTTSSGFFLARHDGRIFVTGNSGTSSASCHRIWLLACEQEPDVDGVRRTRWIVTRDTYKELRETTIKTWLDWFPESDWGQFIRAEPGFHALRQFRNGQWVLRDHPSGDGTKVDCEVIFLAVPDEDVAEQVLASYEITGFFRNEGQFCPKGVIDEFLSRCSRYPSKMRGPGATWFGGWMDMNAPVEGHWVPYMRGDLPLPPQMTDDERLEFEKPDGWKFLVQPPGLIETRGADGRPQYQPNPKAENQKWLTESYLDKIKGKPKEWIDRRVLNKIGLAQHGQPVYPTFNEGDHIAAQDASPRDGYPIVVGLDFGREPAAVFAQEINGLWVVLSELTGSNESAQLFAPRVKRHLSERYPNFRVNFWGDPRGADGNQGTETTAYDVFRSHGMLILPASSDNNPELRRSTVTSVLERRNGLRINPSCLVLKQGMASGYHFARVRGRPGMFTPNPVKNAYSHVVEAFENVLLGGGEGWAVVTAPEGMRRPPSPIHRPKPKFRKRF